MRKRRSWYAGNALSTLYLIRHGQASFGAEDYDVLSELGARQSRELGRYWAGRAHHLDAVYVGPRRRQKDTTTHFLAAAGDAGRDYPDPVELADLDEYPAIELLKHWMPVLERDDPEFADIVSAPAGSGRFERVFEHIVNKWARGELDTGELESFEAFTGRVEKALRAIMTEQGRGKHVAVVTSGGPISVAMRWALSLGDETMLRLGTIIANASVSEFRYRASDALTVVSFNNTPHIEDRELLTYR